MLPAGAGPPAPGLGTLAGSGRAMGEGTVSRMGSAAWSTRVEGLGLVAVAAASVLRDPPERPGARWRALYEANTRPGGTVTPTPDETIGAFRRLAAGADREHRTPYWQAAGRYNGLEIVAATIELLDQHDAPLPVTVLPPVADVTRFLALVEAPGRAVTVSEQFELALSITGDGVVGAANLCWIATRFMARGADRRAYPDLPMSPSRLVRWGSRLVPPADTGTCRADPAGDTYYFWTHVFVVLTCTRWGLRGWLARVLYRRGTWLMSRARALVAGTPVVADHGAASRLGQAVGRALAGPRG
jgi:hypothetical protein